MPSWSRVAALALVTLSASCSALEAGELVSDFSDVLLGTRDVADNVTLADTGNQKSLTKRDCPARCTQYCCLSDGTCIPSLSWSCCGGGIVCGPGRKCCHDGCIDDNEECCRTAGRHCNAGYECWLINGVPKCCPHGECGSSGGGGGSPRPTPPPSNPPPTRPSFDYYTWTVTWTYRVVFYTSITIRTTTTTTTTSVVSFYASNSEDASSSFGEYTATATFSPPASATDPPEPPSGGSGGSSGSGGNLVAVPPSTSGTNAAWNWHAALLVVTALVPGVLAVYL
ncbi:GPI anchored protein [Histoplasma capsulatum H143]|uniref:GPI anchored protein n=1 Tax=Ajellomyces capsulatus (strain H143) TaxID=544712 RepID=C6H5D8_AJECH|nr:GPI anchored protein [Histoplasma capsulatum H143]